MYRVLIDGNTHTYDSKAECEAGIKALYSDPYAYSFEIQQLIDGEWTVCTDTPVFF